MKLLSTLMLLSFVSITRFSSAAEFSPNRNNIAEFGHDDEYHTQYKDSREEKIFMYCVKNCESTEDLELCKMKCLVLYKHLLMRRGTYDVKVSGTVHTHR